MLFFRYRKDGVYMDNVNLNSFKIFLAVATSNSFLEASNKLYISQPAISKSISNLEEDLSVTLFYRENKGIILTSSGQLLLKYINESKDILQICQRELKALNNIEQGNIVIGVQSHIVRNYLMTKIESFRSRHPFIKIRLVDLSTLGMIQELVKRKIDFMIDSSPVESVYSNVKIVPLIKLSTCFIISSNNNSNIRCLKDLEKVPTILPAMKSSLRKNINKCFNSSNANIVPILEVETEELIIDAVRRNMGAGFVVKSATEYLAKQGTIKYVELSEDLPEMEINLVYIPNNINKISKLFLEEEIKNDIL